MIQNQSKQQKQKQLQDKKRNKNNEDKHKAKNKPQNTLIVARQKITACPEQSKTKQNRRIETIG